MTLDELKLRLQKVRKTANGFTALCPAHDDHSPSLSIRDTGTNILMYCHAGCSYREICDALSIGPLETNRGLMATKRGRQIAELSRLSHRLEAAFLVDNYGLSLEIAKLLVRERLQRSQLSEVREFLKARRGESVDEVDYFVVEIGLERTVAEELAVRFKGGRDAR